MQPVKDVTTRVIIHRMLPNVSNVMGKEPSRAMLFAMDARTRDTFNSFS